MTRYHASTAIALVAALSVNPATAQTIDFDGNNVIIDQLTPPGGRCVPTFANTVSFAPGDITSTGTSNLGKIMLAGSALDRSRNLDERIES